MTTESIEITTEQHESKPFCPVSGMVIARQDGEIVWSRQFTCAPERDAAHRAAVMWAYEAPCCTVCGRGGAVYWSPADDTDPRRPYCRACAARLTAGEEE